MSDETTENTLPLKQIIEAALLAAGEPLSHAQLAALFGEESMPPPGDIDRALDELAEDCEGRAVELKKVASGWRLQVRTELHDYVQRLWTERPQRYSRALLETLSLIAYRQPITRGEIEAVRGVSLASSIIRTLQEREWIRVVGHRDIPGKPALFGTTKAFLDYFDLETLDDLPTLAEIRDLDNLEPEFEFDPPMAGETDDEAAAGENQTEENANTESQTVSQSEAEEDDDEADTEDDVAHEDWTPEASDEDDSDGEAGEDEAVENEAPEADTAGAQADGSIDETDEPTDGALEDEDEDEEEDEHSGSRVP